MTKRFRILLILSLLAAVGLSSTAQAQTLQNYPESDLIISLNARRLLNEALPRVLPEAEVAKMRAGFNDLKSKIGIDVTGVDNAVIGLRFRRGAAGQVAPEVYLTIRGSFNADSLLSLARVGLQGKYRDEKVGAKTITVLKMADIAGPGGKNPLPMNIPELALFALDSNTIAGGSMEYVRDAVADGGKRINPELATLASRDASALISVAGVFAAGAIGNLLPAEVRGNQEVMNIVNGVDQLYLSVGMNATDFPLFAMVHTQTPEQANTINGLLGFAIPALSSGIKDPALKAVIDALKVTVQGREVQITTTVSQAAVSSLLQNLMKASPPPPAPPAEKKADPNKKP